MKASPFLLLALLFGTVELLNAATPRQRSTYFDGSSAAGIGFGDSTQYEPTIAMTIEAWIYREDASRCETIVGRNYTQSYWFGVCNGNLRFYRSGGVSADADVTIGQENWVHVAASYDGTRVRFYLDGQLVGDKALSNTQIQYVEPMFIGADNGGFPFLGYLDEVRIWSVARTQNQIQSNLYRELNGDEPGLVFYHPFGGLTEADEMLTGTGRSSVFGILPRELRIPAAATTSIAVDGVVDPDGEYEGAEQWVIRYGNNAGVPDAVAYLVYRNYPGNPLLQIPADENLYVGVKNIRTTLNNWPTTDSWIALHFDRNLSRDALAQPDDFQVQLPIDGEGNNAPEARWLWGNGSGGYDAANPPAPSVAETGIHYARGDVNPPDMEFRIGKAMFPDFLEPMGMAAGHYWIGGVGQDRLAPGDAVWNAPVTWTTGYFSEPDAPLSISGKVQADTGNPIEGAYVVLNGPISGYVVTDALGEFTFPGIPPGNFSVEALYEDYLFDPAAVDLVPFIKSEYLEFTGTRESEEPRELRLPEVYSGITLRLNECLFEPGDTLSMTLDLNGRIPVVETLPAFVVAQPGGDVEYQELVSAGGDWYVSPKDLPVAESGESATPFDGVLSVQPGDEVVALWFVKDLDPQGPPVEEEIIYDYAITLDESYENAPNTMLPELALTEDETNPPEGGKPLATLMGRGGLPVQVPVDELILYPRDEEELNRFLAFTGGTAVGTNADPQNEPDATSLPAVQVKVNTAMVDPRYLPQLRQLFGHEGELFASNQQGFDILQLALLSQLEGYIVTLNPRLQFAGVPEISEARDGTLAQNLSLSTEEVLNVPKLWSFMSLFDFDERRIPMAIMDIGFSPNPDYRGFDGGTLRGCAMNGLMVDCSPGAAFGIPTVGNSLFGDRTWHGNGVVAIAGGVLNNGWGVAGVGGQVVEPIPYKYDLASYAFGIGAGIRHATLNGAAVINLSAGYPCNLQTDIGAFNICDPASRGAFCAAVTASVAAATGAACAATSAFLPFAAPFVCGAATAATVAAGEACIALVAAGDVREPMRSAIEFARDRGVPVVTVAGNNLLPEDLPPVIRDLVDLSDPRVEVWEMFPAMVPDAIVVGATSSVWPYNNEHFFGNRVDVWAPIRANYFAPVDADMLRPFTEHVLNPTGAGIGGSSAAAPYVAGVIAAMQAVDPTLNRFTPGLSDAQRRMIVERVKQLLEDSVWTVDELAGLAPDTATSNAVVAGEAERRNLINPLRAVQMAAEGTLPDLASLGYEGSLGFSESDPARAPDTEAFARFVSSGSVFSDGIYSYPGERGVPDWQDTDWYRFSIPSSPADGPGLYRQRFELRGLRGFDPPLVFPREYGLFLTSRTATEDIHQIVSPMLPNGANGRFVLSGIGRFDYLYQLSRGAMVRVGDLPMADRFDRNDPVETPPESRPDNNIPERAAILGEPGEFEWRFSSGTAFGEHWVIRLPRLTIHELSDVDWFSISTFPPFTIGDLPACEPYVEVTYGDDLLLNCFTADGLVVFLEEESPAVVPAFALLSGELDFRFYPKPDRVAHYEVNFRFYTTNPRICEIASALGDARAAGEARGSGMFLFPSVLPEILQFGPGEFDPLPERTIDQQGRVTTPDAYLIQWDGSGSFSASLELVRGDSAWVRLVAGDGSVRAESRTANIESVPQPQLNGPQLNNELSEPEVGTVLRLNAENLPAGDYLLMISHAYPGTLINLLLPEGSVTDGSPSLEQVMAGPQPEPPTLEFHALLQTGDLVLQWPDGFFDFELQSRDGFNPNSLWQKAQEPSEVSEGMRRATIVPGSAGGFYRLRYQEEEQ